MINLVVLVKQNKIDIKTVFIFIFMRLRKLKKRWLIYRPPGMKGLRKQLVSIFGWQHAKVKSTKTRRSILGSDSMTKT